MNNSKTAEKFRLSFIAVAVLVFSTGAAFAQTDKISIKRLRNPATVKGFVGGEAHNGYVIGARRNQTLKIQVSWQAADGKRVQFFVSRSADFFAGDVLEGGTETEDGKNYTVKIPATADYYIYVTAHPEAKYTLKASLK